MTQEEFYRSLEDTFSACLKIVHKKNANYASTADPFKNFSFSTLVGVGVERAILVRITDKLARISNLLDKEAMVKEESINDTIEDAINYLAILKAKLLANKDKETS